jgi:uncharacterized membrane protein
MTAVTLMLGWCLAVFSGLLALVIVVITGHEPLALFAVNGLITVMVPVLVTHAIMRWEHHRNFRNFLPIYSSATSSEPAPPWPREG